MRLAASPQWLRVQRFLRWSGFLLMMWAAQGLPFDLLTMTGTIGDPATGLRRSVDWPGLATRTLAFAAAFVLALPYPVLRMHWAFGGTLGLMRPGAGGRGFAPLLIAIPFVLAATLSLLLVSPPVIVEQPEHRVLNRKQLTTP